MIDLDKLLEDQELDEILDQCDPFVFLEWLAKQKESN